MLLCLQAPDPGLLVPGLAYCTVALVHPLSRWQGGLFYWRSCLPGIPEAWKDALLAQEIGVNVLEHL